MQNNSPNNCRLAWRFDCRTKLKYLQSAFLRSSRNQIFKFRQRDHIRCMTFGYVDRWTNTYTLTDVHTCDCPVGNSGKLYRSLLINRRGLHYREKKTRFGELAEGSLNLNQADKRASANTPLWTGFLLLDVYSFGFRPCKYLPRIRKRILPPPPSPALSTRSVRLEGHHDPWPRAQGGCAEARLCKAKIAANNKKVQIRCA